MNFHKPLLLQGQRWRALGVAIAYALAGTLWIAYSDQMLATLVADAAMLTEFQTYKGWLFIAGTAFLLYLLLLKPERTEEDIPPVVQQAARHPWPLRWQLLGLSLIIAAPLLALVSFNLYRSTIDAARAAGQASLNLAGIAAVNTETFLADARQMLETLAQRPALLALDREKCDPLLADLVKLQPRFRNALTVNRDGKWVCSAIGVASGTQAGPDPVYWFNPVRESMQFTIGTPALGFISKRWVVTLAYPLRDARGEFIGAVGLAIDLIDYPVLPATTGLPTGTVIGIGSYDGKIIARTPDAQNFVGHSSKDSRIRAAALTAKSGQIDVTGLDGVRRLYGFMAIPGTNWYALAGLPSNTVYAMSRSAAARSAMIVLALMFVIVVAAYAVGRRIEQPLARITAAATAVTTGDRTTRAPLAGSRETIALAAQLNAMLDALDASERRFRETLEHIHLAAVVLDSEGRVKFCNDYLLGLAGWRREEVLGKNWFDAFIPDSAPVKAVFEQGIRDGNLPIHFENEILTRHGERRLIHWSNIILRDPAGRISGTASLGEDVTERARAQEALQRSNARYRALFEGNPMPLLVIDKETLKLLEANPAATEKYGYTREEFLAMTIVDLQAPEDRPHIAKELRDRYASVDNRVTHTERRHVAKDGRIILAEVTAQPDVYGDRQARLISVHDVTERRQADQKIREQLAELLRWQAVMLGREERVQQLKAEINALLARHGEPARYDSPNNS